MKKILIVNDENTDIKYKHTSICNNIELPDLAKLNEIFKMDNDSIFSTNTANAITLIDSNGNEFPLSEYTKNQKISFIRLTNNDLNDNDSDIIMRVSNVFSTNISMMWWVSHKIRKIQPDIPDYAKMSKEDMKLAAYHDYNGYKNCISIIEHARESDPNFSYFDSQVINYPSVSHKIENKFYSKYMPSIGQLKIIFDCFDMLEYIYHRLGTDFLRMDCYWSSSEYSATKAWYINRGMLAIGDKTHLLNTFYIYKETINE